MVRDSFSLDELQRSATANAAATDPGDGIVVPLRGRGWFVPYLALQTEEEDDLCEQNVARGLTRLPDVTYCYMCHEYEEGRKNEHRNAIKQLISLATKRPLIVVCKSIATYHRTWVYPLKHKHWGINSIREHILQHEIVPLVIITENIRGIQAHLDVHVENMERIVEEDEETSEGGSQRPRKRRRIDTKEEESYMKLLRLQSGMLQMHEKLTKSGTILNGYPNSKAEK